MPRKLDITGQRFGRLTVTASAPSANGRTRWHCQCDCGNSVTVDTGALRIGHTKSCSCLQREVVAQESTKHGARHTPEYRAWRAMMARCTVMSNASYPSYGGRGIGVCERWTEFANFLADMGPRPAGTTLDRFPDNDGDYEPGNCRWATKEQQDNNKRTNVFVTFNGKTMTYSQWGRELATDPGVLRRRWLKFKTLNPIQRTKESYRGRASR